MYCNFEYTGEEFNNKKVYKCRDCGITLGLDDPAIKILCFKQQRQLEQATYQQMTQEPSQHIDVPGNVDLAGFVESELIRKSIEAKNAEEAKSAEENKNESNNLCSKEEIEHRLDICNNCEHYKENACMLCGCRVVREANYQNKLAHRDASCPINKWGPIPIRGCSEQPKN